MHFLNKRFHLFAGVFYDASCLASITAVEETHFMLPCPNSYSLSQSHDQSITQATNNKMNRLINYSISFLVNWTTASLWSVEKVF